MLGESKLSDAISAIIHKSADFASERLLKPKQKINLVQLG
jgi:hypothetical protein